MWYAQGLVLYKAIPSRLRKVTVSPNAYKQTQKVRINEEIEHIPNEKKQDKTRGRGGRNRNEMDLNNFPEK